jgi:hypothetical protein
VTFVFSAVSQKIRHLGRLRRRWKDNIRMDLGKIGRKFVEFMHVSGQGPVAGCCEHGNEPSGSIKGGKFFIS